MSGHFSTLLNGTVNTLVQDHDVYLTDWKNPRDIPAAAGEFGFDEFVDHIIDFLKALGPETHLLAVCQPVVACLAAAAIMAEDNDHCQPASLILMAGPIDTRYSPTKVNYLAKENTIEWFEQNVIFTVPFPNLGVGRKVYPGFIQLLAFMSMNRNRHLKAFKQMREHRATGSHEKADTIAGFYREYFAVMDITSKFYLETIERVFQKHDLPLKKLKVRDRQIDCSFIRKPFLLTIEGERDDICGIGQTLAAHDLCNRMPMYKKSHLLQAGVGHYGVFSGKRWERRTYPIVREFIRAAN
jgi:polyhydroxyalkanoate depolymerase